MKRGYTALEYKSIVRRLRAARPELSLTSDFIVGFPGETDADFELTMALVAEVGFDGAFTFAYSPRPGTPPPSCPTRSRRSVKQARLERLTALLDAPVPRLQRRDGRHAAARARHRTGGQGRRASCRRAPRTTASSISPASAALVGRYADVTITAALRAFAARRARRARAPARRAAVNPGRVPTVSSRLPNLPHEVPDVPNPPHLRLPLPARGIRRHRAFGRACRAAPAFPPQRAPRPPRRQPTPQRSPRR